MQKLLFIFSLLLITIYSQAQAPINDDPCGAITLTPNIAPTLPSCVATTAISWTNATTTATSIVATPTCISTVGVKDVWYKIVVPTGVDSILINTKAGITTDPAMSLYTATSCGGPFTLIDCNDDSSFSNSLPFIKTAVTANTYYLRVFHYFATYPSGSIFICINLKGAVPPIDPSKKVGININFPEANLDVNGTTKLRNNVTIDGNLKIQGGTPSAGKILTSDANGNSTWQNPNSTDSWKTNGNLGTNDSTSFVGTRDSINLTLKAQNKTVITITPYKQVVIGAYPNFHQLDASLIINSRDADGKLKAMMLPSMSTKERDSLTWTEVGMFIYNNTTGCLNYWEPYNNAWLALCGTPCDLPLSFPYIPDHIPAPLRSDSIVVTLDTAHFNYYSGSINSTYEWFPPNESTNGYGISFGHKLNFKVNRYNSKSFIGTWHVKAKNTTCEKIYPVEVEYVTVSSFTPTFNNTFTQSFNTSINIRINRDPSFDIYTLEYGTDSTFKYHNEVDIDNTNNFILYTSKGLQTYYFRIIATSTTLGAVSKYSVTKVFATNAQQQYFRHTGGNQTFTVPTGVTKIKVSVIGGGGGGTFEGNSNKKGGNGAAVQGYINTTPGQIFRIIVGGGGKMANDGTASTTGAYGGGGVGGNAPNNNSTTGAGGGGCSRIMNSSFTINYIIAAGGGGVGEGLFNSTGFSGGGLKGFGIDSSGGFQTTGGKNIYGINGSSLLGGGSNAILGSGGGGGGYFGGSSGAAYNVNQRNPNGGSGGSSFIDPSLVTNLYFGGLENFYSQKLMPLLSDDNCDKPYFGMGGGNYNFRLSLSCENLRNSIEFSSDTSGQGDINFGANGVVLIEW